jgi:Fe-S-cluster containining protein
VIFLLFAGTLQAKPIDYDDVENLLPTEPQTTNDTLAAIVQDPVVQDAVQNAVGSGSLQGLVVRKKVLVMPATEPTKVCRYLSHISHVCSIVSINPTMFPTFPKSFSLKKKMLKDARECLLIKRSAD